MECLLMVVGVGPFPPIIKYASYTNIIDRFNEVNRKMPVDRAPAFGRRWGRVLRICRFLKVKRARRLKTLWTKIPVQKNVALPKKNCTLCKDLKL
jgi:hypothetical protein